MKKTLILSVVILSIALFITGSTLAHPTNFRAHLSAAPAAPDSLGQGQANFRLEGNELTYILAVSKLQGTTTAAHIHISAVPDGNGPPVISLCGVFGPAPIPVDNCGGPGNPAMSTVTLTDAQIGNLMTAIAENRAYVNVHTTVAPPGEVRGQVVFNN